MIIVSDHEFLELMNEALSEVPEEFIEKMENVALTFSDMPTYEQSQKVFGRSGRTGLLFGLYEGIPATKRGSYSFVPPDKITLFKRPLMAVSESVYELRRNIKNTLLHEIAHHFGMDETAVRDAESYREKRLRETN
jgi:predicted Zn-dependent protease with MMP-like domain